MKNATSIYLMGVRIDKIKMAETLSDIERFIIEKTPRTILTVNVNCVVKANRNDYVKDIINHADLVLPDGMYLVWATKFLKAPLEERITGSDLLWNVSELSAKKGYRIFLLGAGQGVAQKTAEILAGRNSGLKVVGAHSPSYDFENNAGENEEVVKIITRAKPDILFIGLGFPKQEKWVQKYKDLIHVPVIITIGAAFDFAARRIKRAPVWMQRYGLEWFWRVTQEPRRLWKRYLTDSVIFFPYILSEKIRKIMGGRRK